jgi:hypothetical protein
MASPEQFFLLWERREACKGEKRGEGGRLSAQIGVIPIEGLLMWVGRGVVVCCCESAALLLLLCYPAEVDIASR